MTLDLDYKKIAVLGFSPRTGLELVKYLLDFNLKIIISDSKGREELKDLINKIDHSNIEYDLGNKNSEKILESDLIILSPGVPYDLEILKKARKKGIETISEIEFAYRQSAAEIIAVTGTNGKTTTTELLAAMLSDLNGQKIKAAGNIGIPFISLVNSLKENEKVILELSSFQLEAVKDFKAKIAIYLNYSPDHLDRHHTEKNYRKAKKNVFLNQTVEDYAIINSDDSYLNTLKSKLKAKTLEISSNDKNADLIIKDKKAFYKNKIILNFTNTNLPGDHNKKNAAFAALAAYLSGQTREKIQKAANNYQRQAHRMEAVDNKFNYTIINDSKATNPDSALKALESIDEEIILIAGGQDRNADFSVLKSIIEKKVKRLILLGECSDIIASMLKNSDIEIIKVKNMEKAVEKALEKINRNRALLLSPACPSWDMYSSYKERGEKFKNSVRKLLD